MNNTSLSLSGYFPPSVNEITYYDVLNNLGADVVRIFLLCGVSVLIYCLLNIFVSREKILFSAGPLEIKISDFDYFMLMMGIYFSILGVIYYFNLSIGG